MIKQYLTSSIGMKQIVALTGLMLVLFLVFHLTMNLLVFVGPELYNFFPDKAHSTGLFLRFVEAGLAAVFFIHIGFTVALVKSNRKARPEGYAVYKPKEKRSLATRLMPYTGSILLIFLILHIKTFVLGDSHGPSSMVGGESLGLYGLVMNAFSSPVYAIWYIIAMFAVGFHLAHGIQSTFQSFGFNHPNYNPTIRKISTGIGIFFALAFSSIPTYFIVLSCCKVS